MAGRGRDIWANGTQDWTVNGTANVPAFDTINQTADHLSSAADSAEECVRWAFLSSGRSATLMTKHHLPSEHMIRYVLDIEIWIIDRMRLLIYNCQPYVWWKREEGVRMNIYYET